MKLHYLLGLCLLLPPLQATAAPESFGEVAMASTAFSGTVMGIWLIGDPRHKAEDRYRGVALLGLGLCGIIFHKKICNLGK